MKNEFFFIKYIFNMSVYTFDKAFFCNNINISKEKYSEKFLLSILFNSCRNGNTKIVKLLLIIPEIKESINVTDSTNSTLLNWACCKGHTEIVKLLLSFPEIKESINIADDGNRTPLNWACRKGHTEIVKLLEDYISSFSVNKTSDIQGNKNKENKQTKYTEWKHLVKIGDITEAAKSYELAKKDFPEIFTPELFTEYVKNVLLKG